MSLGLRFAELSSKKANTFVLILFVKQIKMPAESRLFSIANSYSRCGTRRNRNCSLWTESYEIIFCWSLCGNDFIVYPLLSFITDI